MARRLDAYNGDRRASEAEVLTGAVTQAEAAGAAATSLTAPAARASQTAAHGMGGVGKTLSAAALCRDPEIGCAFEKICWVSVGQEPELLQLQKTLHRQLTSKPLPPEAVDHKYALEALVAAGKGKCVLCVLLV